MSTNNFIPLGGLGAYSVQAFFDEISSLSDRLRTFGENVTQISALHSQILNSADEYKTAQAEDDVSRLSDNLRNESQSIKSSIKNLQMGLQDSGSASERRTKSEQTKRIASNFAEAVQRYQAVEQQYRRQCQDRLKRQYKIVKPDATPEEVNNAVSENNGQIFSQALMGSNRYGEGRQAYREVQERQEDIKRIERTMGELAQLFNDIQFMIEQQDDNVNAIYSNAVDVEENVKQGDGLLISAVKSAKNARKGRKICFAITVVVIIVLIAVVAGVVCSKGVCSSGGNKQ